MTPPLPTDQLLLFLPAALALNLTPGADMLFCIAQGARSGPRGAMAAAAGVAAGAMGHALLAAAGLAAFLGANPAAFPAIRWIGAAWLLAMALQGLRAALRRRPGLARQPAAAEPASSDRPALRAFVDAAGLSLANPKAALFTLALLPPFIDLADGTAAPRIIALGALFGCGAAAAILAAGAFGGGFGRALDGAPRAARLLQLLSAALFAGLALRLAAS